MITLVETRDYPERQNAASVVRKGEVGIRHRALAWGLRHPAASERELTDRALYMEFEPRHFCKQIDVARADGAATKAHIGRRQVKRLDHAADILQDQRVCD